MEGLYSDQQDDNGGLAMTHINWFLDFPFLRSTSIESSCFSYKPLSVQFSSNDIFHIFYSRHAQSSAYLYWIQFTCIPFFDHIWEWGDGIDDEIRS